MNRLKLISFFCPAVLLLLLVVSCNTEDTSRLELPDGGKVPVGFSSSVFSLADTRVTTGAITTIDKMYVFASYTGSANWQPTDLSNFMYRQDMAKTVGTWNYTPVKYWPNNTGDKISFFAFAPVDAAGVSWSANNVAGPKLTYIIPSAESEGQDLLLGSAMNKTKEDGIITFLMKHALSQIKFCVKSGSTGTTKILKGLTVSVPNTGTASFAIDGTCGWTLGTPDAPSKLTADNSLLRSGVTVPEVAGSKTDIIAAFFLIPGGNMQSYTVTLQYALQKTGESSPAELIATSHFPASPQWLPGANITYTLTIVDDRLEFGDVTVEAYGDGTSAGAEIPAT